MDITKPENLGLIATIACVYTEMINMLCVLVYVMALQRRRKRKRMRSVYNQLLADEELQGTVDRIGTWIEKASSSLSQLVGCFEYLAKAAEAKKQVYKEKRKIEGFSTRDKFKAGQLIASDVDKVNFFLQLADEERYEYVEWVLGGCQ